MLVGVPWFCREYKGISFLQIWQQIQISYKFVRNHFFKFLLQYYWGREGAGYAQMVKVLQKGGATLKNESMNYEFTFAPKEYEICLERGKSMLDGRR